MSYPSFPSIDRLENVYIEVTEKVDGTNGLIEINKHDNEYEVRFGSRNRYITPQDDNYDFAAVFTLQTDKFIQAFNIMTVENGLGTIRIYGEYFGKSIARGYGLDKRFFMPFSTYFAETLLAIGMPNIMKPYVYYAGKMSEWTEHEHIEDKGSQLIPGYPDPEGVVVYFPSSGLRLKHIFARQPQPKTKTPMDLPPLEMCPKCGKRLYKDKKTGDMNCMNYHCEENKLHG